MICEQLGTADFYAGNESPHQCTIESMQHSNDTLIVLDKHKLQFRLKIHKQCYITKARCNKTDGCPAHSTSAWLCK